MKKVIFSALAVSFVAFTAFTIPVSENNSNATAGSKTVFAPVAKKYTVNPAKSSLAWEAKKVTGQHDGVVKIKKGELQVDKNKPVSGTFEIDMRSIIVKDITDPGYNKKLVDHLNSDDFFSVEKHPVATFKTTDIIPTPNSATSHQVRGNLTIKGITNLITFPANFKTEGNAMRATAEITIDRSKWDVRYGSNSFFEGLGDKAIYDDIKLNLDLVATPGA